MVCVKEKDKQREGMVGGENRLGIGNRVTEGGRGEGVLGDNRLGLIREGGGGVWGK